MIGLRSDPTDGRTAHFWTKPAAVVYFFTSSGVLLEFSCLLMLTNRSEVQEIRRKTHLASMGDVNVNSDRSKCCGGKWNRKRLKNATLYSFGGFLPLVWTK